jgi:hypothetical protein
MNPLGPDKTEKYINKPRLLNIGTAKYQHGIAYVSQGADCSHIYLHSRTRQSIRCTISAVDNQASRLLLCTAEKNLIACTTMNGNEFSEEMLTPSYFLEVFSIEDFQIIIDIVVGVPYIS